MRNLLAAFLIVFSGTSAGAGAFCERVRDVLDNAPTATQMHLPNGVASQCSTSLGLSGSAAVNCAWPHPFRDGSARAAFEAALDELLICFGSSGDPVSDQDVNHPDYYDLRLFHTSRGEVGLSLKDKGALQQTFVFLRIEGLPQ